MSKRKEKFIERNQEYIDRLIKLINKHKGDIRCVLLSSELSYLLPMFDVVKLDDDHRDFLYGMEFGEIDGDRVMFIQQTYLPAGTAQLVLKGENEVNDFDIPCVCGIYSDEEHP